MSTPDPRTEAAAKELVEKWFERCGINSSENANSWLWHGDTTALVSIANDALTTEAARVRGETWREALEKVANDWASKGFCGHDEIQSIEVQAFLDTRHVHYPECRGELSKPTWSTARPTVAGWYWWRKSKHAEPGIVLVYKFEGILMNSGKGGEWSSTPIARPREME